MLNWWCITWQVGFERLMAQERSFLLTFRNNLSVSSSRIKQSWSLQRGPMGCHETPVRNYQSRLRQIANKHRYHFTSRRKTEATHRLVKLNDGFRSKLIIFGGKILWDFNCHRQGVVLYTNYIAILSQDTHKAAGTKCTVCVHHFADQALFCLTL